jgi:hypothetical protein
MRLLTAITVGEAFSKMNREGNKPIRTVDHFIPNKHGGPNIMANKVICCFMCNTIKSDLMPDQVIQLLKEKLEVGFTRKKFNDYFTLTKLQTFPSRR